jgi:hypothetical protein
VKLGPQKGQIGVGISSEYLGLGFTGFCETKPHAPGADDDVAVGQDKAISGDDHTGADATSPSSVGNAFDADDRRANPLNDCTDGPRIGVEWILVGEGANRMFLRLAGKSEH